ncbi:cobalamin B12-binding domain-containing protein [Aromatoleum anaerobium]|nr:cobalamin-dependent protein [Aromatoleum anaerobium]MCK0509059.1 cobalamin-dependent protein [Aromatoleum anaerobium]
MSMHKRILLAKMGLDCHDTGIVTVANILRNAGHEVVYLGLHNFADRVVKTALEEDVDAIGISFLSGQHMTQMRRLIEQMQREGLRVPVFCGGVIPEDDVQALKDMGVADVLLPGLLSDEVAHRVDRLIAREAA